MHNTLSDMLFTKALQGEVTKKVPFWFMRQAGRYLPEYLELRASEPDFLSLCYNPKKASEVTLQPIDRFKMDAAILFSDILVIPDALGIGVRFEKGEGPKLERLKNISDLEKLDITRIENHLSPVFETIKLTRNSLANDKALIGFAGAPWTVACYILQGKGKNFNEALKRAETEKSLVIALIDVLTQATIDYLSLQIEAGVNAVQLFDSWAGLVPDHLFDALVIQPNKIIMQAIKKRYPHIPVIGFAKSIHDRFGVYARETQADGLGVSMDMSLKKTMEEKLPHQALQGNLDPELLANNLDGALAEAHRILDITKNIPFIFNLGHGMVPHTPVSHVQALCDLIKGYERERTCHYV